MRERFQKGCKKNKKERRLSKERKLFKAEEGWMNGLTELEEERTKETKYSEGSTERKHTKFIL